MGVTAHLTFDPTSLTDSSNVGAYVRAGTNGDLIGDQLINAANWLNSAAATFDGLGVAITSTLVSGKQGLDVNVISTTPINVDLNGIYNAGTNPTPSNVGNILFVRNASPGLPQQTFTWTGGQANSDAVVAANVWGGDVNSFLMGFNGTTWDRLQVDGSKNLKVDIANSTATVTVSDAALANTAITNGATPVGVTAVSTVTTPLTNRKYLFYFNNAKNAVYIGTTGVTTANGFPLFAGNSIEIRAGAAIDVKAISSAAAQDTRYMELS